MIMTAKWVEASTISEITEEELACVVQFGAERTVDETQLKNIDEAMV